jgi:hypothetical protein
MAKHPSQMTAVWVIIVVALGGVIAWGAFTGWRFFSVAPGATPMTIEVTDGVTGQQINPALPTWVLDGLTVANQPSYATNPLFTSLAAISTGTGIPALQAAIVTAQAQVGTAAYVSYYVKMSVASNNYTYLGNSFYLSNNGYGSIWQQLNLAGDNNFLMFVKPSAIALVGINSQTGGNQTMNGNIGGGTVNPAYAMTNLTCLIAFNNTETGYVGYSTNYVNYTDNAAIEYVALVLTTTSMSHYWLSLGATDQATIVAPAVGAANSTTTVIGLTSCVNIGQDIKVHVNWVNTDAAAYITTVRLCLWDAVSGIQTVLATIR